MASENESTKLPFNGETGNVRNRGRSRNGKGVKKVPQRGVGVEKLEKMRVEESLKSFHQQQQQLLLSYGAFQFPQQQQQQVMINNNSINNVVVGSGFGGSGFSPFVGNKSGFGVGASSSSWFGRNPFENSSKELSSIPNLNHHHHQSLDLCLKNTRLNEESIMMRGANNAKREMPLEIWNHNHVHHDFLGFMAQPQPSVSAYATQNLNEKTCLNEETIMRGTNARRNMPLEDWNHHGFLGFMPQPKSSVSAYPTQNLDECVEVVAVHRKGNSSFGSGRVFMEYEFFPEKNGKSTTTIPKDFFPTATSGEASSSITTTSYGDTSMAYDSLDLSLRL